MLLALGALTSLSYSALMLKLLALCYTQSCIIRLKKKKSQSFS